MIGWELNQRWNFRISWNPILAPLLDKEGNPIYYQLQYFLESDTDTLNEEQKQMLLQAIQGSATGEIKKFPYKQCYPYIRVLTEVDGKEWLKVKWMWEGLRKVKG